jgi:hypothetical protein
MIFIGHGGAGCKLATMLSDETKSNCITIDTRAADLILPKCKTMEEAEEKTPEFEKLLALKNQEIIFITAGSGNTSGSILRVLSQIKDNKIDIIYIRPDLDLLNKEQVLKERVVYKVLQESTRAGLFNKIYLVDNKTVAKSIPDISLEDYFDKINEAIVFTFNFVNYILDEESTIRENLTETKEVSRICAFGNYSFSTEEESYFFPIENITEKYLLYCLCKKTIQDKNILDKISKQIKTASQNDVNATYKIVSSTDNDYVFNLCFTHFVQD